MVGFRALTGTFEVVALSRAVAADVLDLQICLEKSGD
jgi:hypothetical protein